MLLEEDRKEDRSDTGENAQCAKSSIRPAEPSTGDMLTPFLSTRGKQQSPSSSN